MSHTHDLLTTTYETSSLMFRAVSIFITVVLLNISGCSQESRRAVLSEENASQQSSEQEPAETDQFDQSGKSADQYTSQPDSGGPKHTNALIHETSPYLLQHAHNPVNWHPWGEKAFKLASEQNKPIFLSVGYSTCYWCHVMERESFEDEDVAAILNKFFIAIKVDREERPDVDEQYMLATQLLTGRGGWPNSVWLLPDGRPFMAGTYFPKDSFVTLLKRLNEVWNDKPDDVEKQAAEFVSAIRSVMGSPISLEPVELSNRPLDGLLIDLESKFDAKRGGFGDAPKFPPHGYLSLLIADLKKKRRPVRQLMLTKTLDSMWLGGIHDHIGGGFHRYSTDERWLLPHFEKMLYDNAQLMRSYSAAFALTKNKRYQRAVDDIYAWLEREMTHPSGGFYSAIDSESESEEGKYYVWTTAEVEQVLDGTDAKLFMKIYQFSEQGNFAEEATGHRTGANIPYRQKSIRELAKDHQIDEAKFTALIDKLRNKLLRAREARIPPHLDDKVLASWNGLMIAGLATAGRVFDEPKYTESASKAADFIVNNMYSDGKLMRTWRNGEARLPGYFEDYAFFADGLVELHVTTGDKKWLDAAERIADAMLGEFEDKTKGGFYFTSDDHQELLARSKNLMGGGNIPTGNGVAASVLLRLFEITGKHQYKNAANRTLVALSGVMEQNPFGVEDLLLANHRFQNVQKDATEHVAKKSRADFVAQRFPLTIEAFASKSMVRVGEEFEVAVKIGIAEGWHLYGANPDAKFLTETVLELNEGQPLTFVEQTVSEPKSRADPVLKIKLNLYEKEVWLRQTVKVDPTAKPTEPHVSFTLKTQACDEVRCASPESVEVRLPVKISNTATGEEKNQHVFDN